MFFKTNRYIKYSRATIPATWRGGRQKFKVVAFEEIYRKWSKVDIWVSFFYYPKHGIALDAIAEEILWRQQFVCVCHHHPLNVIGCCLGFIRYTASISIWNTGTPERDGSQCRFGISTVHSGKTKIVSINTNVLLWIRHQALLQIAS